MTIDEAKQKIEELKNFLKQEDEELPFLWVKIDYSVIPQALFEKYGVKPFEIMKRKMRNKDGKVWNNINYFDAQKECEKLGFRLPNIREMLMLLEYYKNGNQIISYKDKEFLGIEELSYGEDVCYEWIYCFVDVALERGGHWDSAAYAGVFTLNLNYSPSYASTSVGFRCVREIK